MHTSTLPVGTGSVVDFIPPATHLEPATEPSSACSPPTIDLVVQTAGAEIACEPNLSSANAGRSSGTAIRERRRPEDRPASVATPTRRPIPQRTCSLMGVQIVGSGSYVPDNIVTNADLRERYGFDPNWIEQRTGIFARRHAPRDQATSDLCVEAAKRAIENADVRAEDIDLLVIGTFTPDHICPSTACIVQEKLGLDLPAFDVSAACSGFVYSLATAAQFVATGNSKLALVIGADVCSRVVNPLDKKIAPLFGDGAGAVLISRGTTEQGLLCYQLGADGGGGPLLECPATGTRNPVSVDDLNTGRQFLNMDGRNVFIWAVRVVEETINLVLAKAGVKIEDVSLFLLHQANARILDHAVEKLGIPADKVMKQVDRYGNTSAGSIPLVLDEANRAGRIKRGDTILMCGFGAGLTWGTSLFRW